MLWKIGGGLLLLAVAFILIRSYGSSQRKLGAADEAKSWEEKVVAAERGKLVAYQAGVASVQAADNRYVETVRDRIIPITKTIIERTAAYAATPAGAFQCLPAERVLWLEQTRSSLFDPAATTAPDSAEPALPSDPTDEATRRVYEQSGRGAQLGSGGRRSFRLRPPASSWSGSMAQAANR